VNTMEEILKPEVKSAPHISRIRIYDDGSAEVWFGNGADVCTVKPTNIRLLGGVKKLRLGPAQEYSYGDELCGAFCSIDCRRTHKVRTLKTYVLAPRAKAQRVNDTDSMREANEDLYNEDEI